MNKKKILILIIIGILLGGIAIGLNIKLNDKWDYLIKDTLETVDGTRATVILLGGQSNAAGCSRDDYLKQNVSEEKYLEYQKGYDNVYINYYVSGTNLSSGFVKCSTCQGETGGFFGPELGLAEKLNECYPDEKFFIIKWTWSGTNLFEQWLSPSSKGKTGDLYKGFVKFVNTNLKYLKNKGYDIKIEGMCWMQGESDSFSLENAINYDIHLENFITDIRKEFNYYASNDGMAFIDAYIANNPIYWVYCKEVNESKEKVASKDELNKVIDTNLYGLTCDYEPVENPDRAHYDSLSQIKLGHLYCNFLAEFYDWKVNDK